MTRSTSVARGATSLLTSRLAVAVIALAFLGVTTRLLSLEEMAVFAVYNTFCGFLTVVCSLGLLSSCIKRLPGLLASGRLAEAADLGRLSAGIYLGGAVTVTLLLLLAATPISRLLLKTGQLGQQVRWAAAAALCFGLYEASQLMLSASQRFGAVSAYNVTAALAQRVLSLLLLFPFGIEGYLAGFAFGSLLGAGLGLRTLAPQLRLRDKVPGPPRPRARDHVAYAVPFYADGYLRYFSMHADQLLVGIFLEPASLAIYFVAKRFLQYCQVLVSSLVDPLGTKVAELAVTDGEAVRRAFSTSLTYFLLLFVPLSVALACSSPFLLWAIGGERYMAGVIPLALLFLSLPFYAVYSHLWTFAYVLGRPAERLRCNLVATVSQGAGMVALMPSLGLAGLAVARSLGFGVAAFYARGRLDQALRVGSGGAVRRAGAASLVSAGACAATILVPHLLVGRPVLIPLYVLPAGGAALLCLLVCLAPEDRLGLARMVPGRGRASTVARAVLAGPGGTMERVDASDR